MGGREYEAIAGGDAQPNLPALLNVIERGALALPTFAAGGPFSGRPGELLNADGLSGSERAALATLYVVLMTELLIESLGARGDILIDGPLAKNPCFGPLLAALLPSSNVLLCTGDSNTRALCYLGGFPDAPSKSPQRVQAVHVQGLADYRASWRRKT
jgi:hypothetical protein